MSFQQGLSGLNASSKNLEVIGNNVANANTVGAKSSRAEFGDMYANAMNGSGSTGIGIGVKLQAVAQQFTQGAIASTENPLDLAIDGNGFFEVSNGSQTLYTRNGQFQANKDGFITNNAGMKLMGYPADRNGMIQPGGAVALQLPTGGSTALTSTALMRDTVSSVRTSGDQLMLDLAKSGGVSYGDIKAFN